MQHFTTIVTSNDLVCENFYEMVFSWKTDEKPPLPGQFFTILASKNTVPLLRRPFAFSGFNVKTGNASMIYKKCGTATEILSKKNSKDHIDIIGPLGNSFVDYDHGINNILIAGGAGFGPMLFFKNHLLDIGRKVLMITGARTNAQIPQNARLDPEKAITICTEDGSEGFCGTVIDCLKSQPEKLFDGATFFCCGPVVMLKACHDFASSLNRECFVSMEQVMACGVGACMGCAVNITGAKQFARVCTEGPIFNSKTIAWT
ncbi:MAG TPA: dihydroorotate dehydrogenase electron transfer subunit [Fibrobacteres bacterium]|jgi:dihydroorotate dehydrogenase electron transfer subunit|nr:dihydroorotate dehydrogenase electron transfer subunit [Fibrobacterota bacterium]